MRFEIGKSYRITHRPTGDFYEIKICNFLSKFCMIYGAVYHDTLEATCVSWDTVTLNCKELFKVEEIETIEVDVKNYNWSEV